MVRSIQSLKREQDLASIFIEMVIFTLELGETTPSWMALISLKMGNALKVTLEMGNKEKENTTIPTAIYTKGNGRMISSMGSGKCSILTEIAMMVHGKRARKMD